MNIVLSDEIDFNILIGIRILFFIKVVVGLLCFL